MIQSGALTNAATGTLQFSASNLQNHVFTGDLTNNGTVLVERSTGFNKPSGAYLNNGIFSISTDQTLTVSNTGAFEQADRKSVV